MKKLIVPFSFLLVLGLAGCMNFKEPKYDSNAQGLSEGIPADGSVDQPTFGDIQKYVITPYCISCHNTANAAYGIDLSTYSATLSDPEVLNPGSPAGSSFFTSIETGDMPKNDAELSKPLKDLVFNWIKAGAPEKAAPSAKN